MSISWLAFPGLIIWLGIILLPWRPWSTRENLDADPGVSADLSRVTVLIPARDEAEVISKTLSSLLDQGQPGGIILVDDQSEDGTAECARSCVADEQQLKIISGQALESGWSGKLWALEQGRQYVTTDYTLLLDADIALKPGTLATLLKKADEENLDLVSLMALLRMKSFWELLLMPAFIYFFKLLYPFAISNSSSRLVAAAAGGCILVRTKKLEEIGGFAALKNALIDDCSLARKVKQSNGKTWIGLTHSAVSHRNYDTLDTIWNMVARTAYTQLFHSVLLLLFCTAIMVAAFLLPPALVVVTDLPIILICCVAMVLMVLSYLPVIRYYDLNLLWLFTLPVAALFYLCMTWSSAIRHWQGTGAVWKNRAYSDPAI